MAFHTQDSIILRFDTYEALIDHCAKEAKSVGKIPIEQFLAHGGRFTGDRIFGTNESALVFTQAGLRALARKLAIPYEYLIDTQTSGLSTDILNDRINDPRYRTNLEDLYFITDARYEEEAVIGIVSDQYVGYSNETFICESAACLAGKNTFESTEGQDELFSEAELPLASVNYQESGFKFHEAIIINTKLAIRLESKTVEGVISGLGGSGTDRSAIGIQFQNSMNGLGAAGCAYYIERLICKNGLVRRVGQTQKRVFHTGTHQSFLRRLANAIQDAVDGITNIDQWLKELASLGFNPRRLSECGGTEKILGVIPGPQLKNKCEELVGPRPSQQAESREARILERDTEMIRCIPELIGGKHSLAVFDSPYRDNASMFDFINVFTEHAHSLPIPLQVKVQERAGDLADWIIDNKECFA